MSYPRFSTSGKDGSIPFFTMRFLLGYLTTIFLAFASSAHAGAVCEVVSFSSYERAGVESVGGIFFQVIEKCVEVTIRNKDTRARWATDFDVTVTFEDGEERSRHIEGEEDRLVSLEPGAEHTTGLCFGSSRYKVLKVDCDY